MWIILIIPDISKWNISNPECFNTSSFNSNSNSISIKENKSDSIMSEDIMINSNLSKDISSLKDINNNNKDFSKDEDQEFSDYYDNFYN